MLIHLVRHAIAAPREEYASDYDRPLTEKGARRMYEITAGLTRLGVQLNEIWTSPLIRARQTADILGRLHGFHGPVRRMESLAPGGDHGLILGRLAEAGVESLALVGHEPGLGELCARMLGGAPDRFILFKKGAVACIDVDGANLAGGGVLQWLLQPGQLRGSV